MTLQTHRLELREFTVADAEFVVRLLNQPSFIRFIGDKGVRTVDDAKNYLVNGPLESYKRYGFGLWLVELEENKRPIGMCGLLKRETLPEVDLGFAFLPEYWGRGYAFEAAAAAVVQARDVFRLPRLLAITNPDNDASVKLLNRLGFEFEKLMKLSSDAAEVKVFSLVLTSD